MVFWTIAGSPWWCSFAIWFDSQRWERERETAIVANEHIARNYSVSFHWVCQENANFISTLFKSSWFFAFILIRLHFDLCNKKMMKREKNSWEEVQFSFESNFSILTLKNFLFDSEVDDIRMRMTFGELFTEYFQIFRNFRIYQHFFRWKIKMVRICWV